jgi:hypothetical protein
LVIDLPASVWGLSANKTATHIPPENVSEGVLTVVLVFLINPALAVIPSHHENDATGKNK